MKVKYGLLIISVMFSTAVGQTTPDLTAMRQQRAVQELTTALNETHPTNKGSYVWVRAMTADLMWSQDEEKARRLFKDLWTWINKQDAVEFDKADSCSTLLVRLFKRDPTLARELISSETDAKNENQVIKIASELVENQPSLAGELLDQAISRAPTLEALNVLARLQSRDLNAANEVALRLLRGLGSQSPSVSLPVIYSLNYYVFPPRRGGGERVIPVSNVLRQQYFNSAYDVLTRSLREQSASQEGGLQKRFQLAQLAYMLALLSREYAPLRQIELQNLALQLSTDMPADVRQITKALLERIEGSAQEAEGNYKANDEKISPSEEILHALARKDFDEAKWILDRMDDGALKSKLRRTIKVSEFSFLSSKGQLTKALAVAVSLDDADRKIAMLNELAGSIYSKGPSPDATLTREFRLAVRSLDNSLSKALMAYSVAALAGRHSAIDALEWVRYGNNCLNSLDSSKRTLARKQLTQFEQSFVEVGRMDFDNVIVEVNIISDPLLKQIAKLAACESWLTVESIDSKP